MIGYSDDETPTPFILLANGTSSTLCALVALSLFILSWAFYTVQLRLPEALVLDTIQRADLRTCVNMILRFVRTFLILFFVFH